MFFLDSTALSYSSCKHKKNEMKKVKILQYIKEI